MTDYRQPSRPVPRGQFLPAPRPVLAPEGNRWQREWSPPPWTVNLLFLVVGALGALWVTWMPDAATEQPAGTRAGQCEVRP